MNKKAWLGLTLAMVSQLAVGAECRVNGKWYPYSSPECSGVPGETSGTPAVSSRASDPQAGKITWQGERAGALKFCQGKYPDNYTMQQGCMINEERGVLAFQGDFGMPPEKASKAKSQCRQKYDSWSLRQGCMLNESSSYKKLYK